MEGRIYSEQKCPVCGGPFVHDEKRRGLFCREHPKQQATGQFIIRFGRNFTKRARSLEEAEYILTGIRYEKTRGKFDIRDYKKSNPLGFENLVRRWYQVKEKEVKPKTLKTLKNYMEKAIEAWGQINIKDIGYGEIEDFLYSFEGISNKTRHNIKSNLHDFWQWLHRRKVLTKSEIPEFPECKYELGWRNTIDLEKQDAILNEVKQLTYDRDPKIWFAMKMASTYISLRPGDLRKIKEKDIDLVNGYVFIEKDKTGKGKHVPLIQEDIDFILSLPRGLPDMHYFRHWKGLRGVHAGTPYGKNYLYRWWKKACANLGIEDVDFYGGTRHGTAKAMRKVASPEEIRRGTMHATNKAFERYYKIEGDEVRDLYEKKSSINQKSQNASSNIKLVK